MTAKHLQEEGLQACCVRTVAMLKTLDGRLRWQGAGHAALDTKGLPAMQVELDVPKAVLTDMEGLGAESEQVDVRHLAQQGWLGRWCSLG